MILEDKNCRTVFYVDDDVDDLDFFKEAISEINDSVSLFDGGDKLLTTLFDLSIYPSVIFLDLNMPIKSGFDVLKEIKNSTKSKNIPVIILTTSINPSDIELCKKLGANLYIRKPTSVDCLKNAIKFVLAIDWDNFVAKEKEFVYSY